jgi:hypothetical protein
VAKNPKADHSLSLVPGPGGARIETGNGAVHYLNQTAAVVWLLADGSRDAANLAEAVAAEFGLSEPPLADIELALAQLAAKGLLQDG